MPIGIVLKTLLLKRYLCDNIYVWVQGMRDIKTGLMSPPEHQCYQDEAKLCRLREYPDSNFQCVYKVEKWCEYAVAKKDDKQMFWVGVIALIGVALDVWNHRKVKDKTSNRAVILVEIVVALGSFIYWGVSR